MDLLTKPPLLTFTYRKSSTGVCEPVIIPNGTAPSCGTDGNPALPTCPSEYSNLFKDFGPGYPSCDDGNCGGYNNAVASIKSSLIPCPDDRTDAEVSYCTLSNLDPFCLVCQSTKPLF